MAERVHVRIEGDALRVVAALAILGLGLHEAPSRQEGYVVVSVLKQSWDRLPPERIAEALRLQGLSGSSEVIGGSESEYV